MLFHNTEKTETRHGNASQVSFVARTTTAKYLTEAGFDFVLHKVVFIVSLVDWCACMRLNVRISWLEKQSATETCYFMPENPKEIMEHIDATITFSRRCN